MALDRARITTAPRVARAGSAYRNQSPRYDPRSGEGHGSTGDGSTRRGVSRRCSCCSQSLRDWPTTPPAGHAGPGRQGLAPSGGDRADRDDGGPPTVGQPRGAAPPRRGDRSCRGSLARPPDLGGDGVRSRRTRSVAIGRRELCRKPVSIAGPVPSQATTSRLGSHARS